MYSFRKEFPVLSHSLYANTASTGLLSEGLQHWRQEHDLDFLLGGSVAKMEQLKLLSDTRNNLATLLECSRDRVALVQNFTLGLNILLGGLSPKCKILLLESDYPSVNWPFEKRDFSITTVPISWDLEEKIYEKVSSDNIDVLALSLVQWLNGFKIDMDFLKNLKRDFPNLMIIADGTQFCGTAKFNFDASGIDVLGSSGYKWMLSGFGNGFMLLSKRMTEEIKLQTVGYFSAGINIEAKDSFRFAKHFEPGHLSTLNFGSLNYNLETFFLTNFEQIIAQIDLLSEQAKREFQNLGLLEETITKREAHSTIFSIKGDQSTYDLLTDSDIICSQRGEGIRLSFHFYNTIDDISRIAEVLKSSS
ncbi:MAG: aminotransferase class V-fold PLP-dependent enzyme [Flavobacteriaceae bacterium]